MDVAMPEIPLSALRELRVELQGKLEALVQTRSEVELQLQAPDEPQDEEEWGGEEIWWGPFSALTLSDYEGELKGPYKDIESRQRVLELLEVSERQLAGDERGTSNQVRGSAEPHTYAVPPPDLTPVSML
jgi:hypothetical protein